MNENEARMIEFTPWPKIARLNRDIVITEKIDGTNAAVGIVYQDDTMDGSIGTYVPVADGADAVIVYAQSRKNLITPDRDNFGFARWVADNAEALANTLGPGLHFGEWWGSGIQRGYGLPKGEKRFSLFNTKRWAHGALNPQTGKPNEGLFDAGGPQPVRGLDVVPVLYEGLLNGMGVIQPWNKCLQLLRANGSVASPGFMRPEGIVVYHTAANQMFKVTLEGDEAPKSLAA